MSLAYNWSKTCSFPSYLHHATTIHFTRWFSCLYCAFDITLRSRGLNHQFYYELQIHYVSLYIKLEMEYCHFAQNLCLVATTQEYLMVGRPRENNSITILRDADDRGTPQHLGDGEHWLCLNLHILWSCVFLQSSGKIYAHRARFIQQYNAKLASAV
jgi:hypothetical protein